MYCTVFYCVLMYSGVLYWVLLCSDLFCCVVSFIFCCSAGFSAMFSHVLLCSAVFCRVPLSAGSAGMVFSYTESGVQRQQCGWEQSVAVPLVAPGNQSSSFRRRWDVLLEEFACQDTWTPHRCDLLLSVLCSALCTSHLSAR